MFEGGVGVETGLVRVMSETGDDTEVGVAWNYGMSRPDRNNGGNHCLMGWV